ncbi:hypothetical protein [Streptomyces sp. NPDC052701]|uniref:hypothetical protein n=1 Tax=Streptomyces sp. NPDC052701 TaxID=3155533 RepID=UPI003440E6C7
MAETPRPETEQTEQAQQTGAVSVASAVTDGIRAVTPAGRSTAPPATPSGTP